MTREETLAARKAYVEGRADCMISYGSTPNTSNYMAWENRAKERYPLMVPNIATDATGVSWKAEGNDMYFRCDGGDWRQSVNSSWYVTKERVDIWSRLFAKPEVAE